MIVQRAAIVAVLAWALLPGAALADACRRVDDRANARNGSGLRECRDEDRLRPYEPGAIRSGRDPGFVDLGNGTELRVGGRVRMDYDWRR